MAGIPQHIAFIMDGNGRWAKAQGMLRHEGHRAGAKTVRLVVEECRRRGVRYVSLFAFSTENWRRPAAEVNLLMRLFQESLFEEVDKLAENGIRLRAIGHLHRLPKNVQEALAEAQQKTAQLDKLDLILAVSYSGRSEILAACKSIAQGAAQGSLSPQDITEETFRKHLFAPDIPDPDLLVRTSGEMRISNFLLWQLAYSEIYVTEKKWPEFDKDEFEKCLQWYQQRERRFGLTGEQAKQQAPMSS